MEILAVDNDCDALSRIESSLHSVFPSIDIQKFRDAMSAYQYCMNHKKEIQLIFIALTFRPFDGFKLSEVIDRNAVCSSIVFTTRTDNQELAELVQLNGNYRRIVKPVTPEKIRAADGIIADCWHDEDTCRHCIFDWCESRLSDQIP